MAHRYGLDLLPLPQFLAQRRAAWPVPLLNAGDLAAASAAWPDIVTHAPEVSGRDILCIDGRAALLDAATVRAFVGSARVAVAAADAGCGVLLVEQHVHKAMTIADRVVVLRRGRLELEGTVDDLRSRLDEIQASYLEAEPGPDLVDHGSSPLPANGAH